MALFGFLKGKKKEFPASKKSNETIPEQLDKLKNLYFAKMVLANKMPLDNTPLEEQIKFLRNEVMQIEPLSFTEGETVDELRADLIKTEGNYNRIIDNHIKNKSELAIDLRDYFLALHSLKMAWCIMETDLSNEGAEQYGDRTAGARAKKEEIEKKFNHILFAPPVSN